MNWLAGSSMLCVKLYRVPLLTRAGPICAHLLKLPLTSITQAYEKFVWFVAFGSLYTHGSLISMLERAFAHSVLTPLSHPIAFVVALCGRPGSHPYADAGRA